MRAIRFQPAILFFAASLATAQIYTWVDEDGNTHFGDSPPEKAGVEQLELPEGPSEDEIAAAQEDLRRSLEARQESESSQEDDTPEAGPTDPATESPAANYDSILGRELTCFTPLSAFVTGESGKLNAPITPSQLTEAEESQLKGLFGGIARNWRGKMEDIACKGNEAQPDTHSLLYELTTVVEWDARDSQLSVESDSVGKTDRTVKDLVQNYKVDAALYIREGEISSAGWTDMTVEGNKVEILMQNRDSVAFLIKRRAPRGYWVSEIRHIEASQDKLLFKQVYFAKDILTGWRTWTLGK